MYKIIIFLLSINATIVYSQELNVQQLGPFNELRIDGFEVAPNGNWLILLDNNEVLLSENQGLEWTPLFFPDSLFIYEKCFFDDSTPVIRTDAGLYAYTDNIWEKIDLPNEYGKVNIYKDEILFYTAPDFYVSDDYGQTFIKKGEISNFIVTEIRADDSSYYVVGDTMISASTTIRTYDKSFNLLDQSSPLYNNRAYRFFQVNEEGHLAYTIAQNYGGADGTGSNLEFAYGGEFIFGSTYFNDLIIFKEYIIYSFKGYNLGVYNYLTGEFKDIEIGVIGDLTTNGEKLFLNTNSKILDLSDITGENFIDVTPDLKREYFTIENFILSQEGSLACNTGYNLYRSADDGNTWFQLELQGDNILDFKFKHDDDLILLGTLNFYHQESENNSVVVRPHGLYGVDVGTMYTPIISFPSFLFSVGDIIFVNTSAGGLTGSYSFLSEDQGGSWIENKDFDICSYYSENTISESPFFLSDNTIGQCDSISGEIQYLWEHEDLGIGGSKYDFQILPIDDSLIHLHPNRSDLFSYFTTDLGQSVNQVGSAPLGKILKGVNRNSTFVYENNKDYLYFRDNLDGNYSEIDITSLPDINQYQSNGSGNLYLKAKNDLYRIDSLLFYSQTISGELYLDQDGDCTMDNNEVFDQNSWQFTLTGNGNILRTFSINGKYNFHVPKGTYTLEVYPTSSRWNVCQEEYEINIDTDDQEYIQNIGISSDELCSDLKIDISTALIRRGRSSTYYVEVENIGNEKNIDSYIDITLDKYYEAFDFNPSVFEMLNDSILRLRLEELKVTESDRFSFKVNVSASAPLGYQHRVSYELFSNNCCQISSPKQATEYKLNTGPYDPNDMRVFNSRSWEAYNMAANEEQTYHIRFQNTGNDTAFDAKIRVQIDSYLDLNTLQILGSSHDLIPGFNDVGELVFMFDDIMLPDSTTNENASHGFVRFKINHKELPNLDYEFNSVSAIYFDYNYPIITNFAKCKIGQECGLPESTIELIELCQGESYSDYNETGVYYDILKSSAGCDSISMLDLRIHPSYVSSYIQMYFCEGDSYLGRIDDFQLFDTLITSFGCDSVLRYSVRFHKPEERTEELILCQGDTIQGYFESGVYLDTIVTQSRCIYRTVNVRVVEVENVDEHITLCPGETYNGYSVAGLYSDTIIILPSRCTSYYNLIIENADVSFSQDTIDLCYGESYNGIVTGTIIDTLATFIGCDSIVTRVIRQEDLIFSIDSVSICPGENYNGYYEEGDYIEEFVSIEGCDSLVYINLTWLPDDSVDCVVSDVTEESNIDLRVFPNPTSNRLNIESPNSSIESITIYNSVGRIVEYPFLDFTYDFDIEWMNPGVKILLIKTENGSTVIRKFIKI